jgi:hypothetical protein
MTVPSVHRVNPLSDPRWDTLVARHPKASVFHQRAWLEALHRTYAYEPLVFTTSSPSAELKNGILFCHVDSWLTGHRLVSLPFSDHCEPICDSIEEMETLIGQSQAFVNSRRWRYLELRPMDEQFAEIAFATGLEPAGRYFLHMIDLRPSPEEIFHGFNKDSVQRRVTRADRAGLLEKCGNSDDLLRDFYDLLVMTRGRHHLPPQPYAWFQNLVNCQGKSLEIRLAYKDQKPIAGILTLRFGTTTHFKYGCSDARFNKFGATPWLLWKAIAAAKSQGALAFDMGRTQDNNAGLLAFKNNWALGNRQLNYWRGPAGSSSEITEGWKLGLAKRVFSHLPHGLLVMSGKLMYRHIG